MPERTYTEEEVAAIFARAAERQRPASTRDSSMGLTLAEIEEAGREAGLDPSAVRAAAGEFDAQHRYPERTAVSVAERWVEGPLSAGAWEDLVASLRHRFGSSAVWWGNDTASLGTADEWTHTSSSGVSTTVTLSPREGRTLLRVVQEDSGFENAHIMGWGMAAFIALIPAMVSGALVAETFGFGNLAGVLAVLLVFASSVAVGGPWVTARVWNSRVRLAEGVQTLADDLAGQIGGDRSRPLAEDGSTAADPLLGLSALPDAPPEADVQAERQRVRP